MFCAPEIAVCRHAPGDPNRAGRAPSSNQPSRAGRRPGLLTARAVRRCRRAETPPPAPRFEYATTSGDEAARSGADAAQRV